MIWLIVVLENDNLFNIYVLFVLERLYLGIYWEVIVIVRVVVNLVVKLWVGVNLVSFIFMVCMVW